MRIAFYPLKEFPNHPNTLTEQVIMESLINTLQIDNNISVSYTHLRDNETEAAIVCRIQLE